MNRVHSDSCYRAWSVSPAIGSLCLSLPCLVPAEPHTVATLPLLVGTPYLADVLWLDVREKVQSLSIWRRLQPGSLPPWEKSALERPGFFPCSSWFHPHNSYSHLLESLLTQGGCSFLSAIKSNFGCYFHYCKVAHAYDLSIRKTNGRRDSHPLILLAPKTATATVEEPPRSLSRL